MAGPPDEPRDERGRWAAGGGGGSDASTPTEHPTVPDERVLLASGDTWNRDTAARLEKEYTAALPALHDISVNASGREIEITDAATGWDSLSGSDQSSAEEQYVTSNYDSSYESEVSNWHENGGALQEAAHHVADNDDWKAETLSEYLEARQEKGLPDIPYSAEDLLNAITITPAEDNYESSKFPEPEIEFDDKHLEKPLNWAGSEQLVLPGVEPEKPSSKLTQDMRDDITKYFNSEFETKTQKASESVEAPEYLSESAKESVDESWSSMDDSEKYEWAKQHTSLTDTEKTEAVDLQEPDKWNPLDDPNIGTENYKRTQAMAKYISETRAVQLMAERKIGKIERISADTGEIKRYEATPDINAVQVEDNKIWSGWKGSSTGAEGRILQVAAAEELGGRLREAPPPDKAPGFVSSDDYKAFATSKVAQDGTLEEFSAAIKAHQNPGGLAALIKGDKDMSFEQKQKAQEVLESVPGSVPALRTELVDGEYDKKILLPDLKLSRNGAASFTTDLSVANAWGGTTNYATSGLDKKKIIGDANEIYRSIGGFDGVKALVRAKWETTQYMLDRADMPTLDLYRGINYKHTREGDVGSGEFNPPFSGVVTLQSGSHETLYGAPVGKSLHISSGKTIIKTSDKDAGWAEHGYPKGAGTWKYDEPPRQISRVVVRAEVPRTAVLSVPAYGVNVHSEHEVVVTGTGWKHWDAYSDTAPNAARVPIGSTKVGSKPGDMTIKLTPEQEDIVSKYKKTIPSEQQL